MIRAWQRSSGFLVDRGPTRTPVVDSLSRALPAGPWRELHDCVRLDARGKVAAEYGVSTWSIGDELSIQAYAVLAGELRERTVRTFYGDARPDLEEEKEVLTGLRDVDDRKTVDFLEKALASEKQRDDDHAARHGREGEARVAAIPGATDDPGFGADYLRAQKVLRDRVRSYGEALSTALLRTLGRFGSGPSLDAYVAACRCAAFDRVPDRKNSTPTEPEGLPWRSAADLAELRELKGILGTLQRRLLDEAEGQDHADAMQNAAAYRKAAELVGKAAGLIDAS